MNAESDAGSPGSRRALVILNPTSGQHDADRSEATILAALEERGVSAQVRRTSGAGDAETWAASAESEGFDLVVAAGGDGTAMEVITGLIDAGSGRPVLLAPLGTGNVLSRVVNLPFNLKAALQAGLDGQACAFDVGRLEGVGRYFMLSAGVGIDADVVRDANREMKDRLGFFAYVWATLKNIVNRRRVPMRVTLDGETQLIRAHTLIVFNASQIYLGGVELGPGVNPHDGALDIAVMHESSALGTLGSLLRLFTGRLKRQDERPEHLRAKTVTLEALGRRRAQVDGEPLETEQLSVKVLPGAVKLLVPEGYNPKRDVGAAP